MSPPESSPSSPKPRRRWLRWVKRGALAGLTGLVLLVVFHRPLLRWGIGFGAKKFADSSGLTFAGRVGGSVLGGLALDEWEMAEAGGDITTEGPVRRLSWSKLALDYDLWALRRGGPGTVLQRLVLHDAEVDLDLRVPPEKQKPKKEKDPSEPAASLPRVMLPELDLRNVNVHIVMEDNEITVRGFTLTWRDGAPGEFQLDELELAASGFVIRDLRGVTEKQGDVLVLRDFSLPHDTRLDRMHDGLLPLELRVRRGELTEIARLCVHLRNRPGPFAPEECYCVRRIHAQCLTSAGSWT